MLNYPAYWLCYLLRLGITEELRVSYHHDILPKITQNTAYNEKAECTTSMKPLLCKTEQTADIHKVFHVDFITRDKKTSHKILTTAGDKHSVFSAEWCDMDCFCLSAGWTFWMFNDNLV